MIAFLLANRTVAEILGALILVVSGWGLWIHHDRVEQSIGAAACQAKVTETKQDAKADQDKREAEYEQQKKDADTERAKELANLPVIHIPLLLHDGALCASPLPNPTAASSTSTNGGGTQPGSGSDIRPAIEKFKLKYEVALADCRSVLAKWPRQNMSPSGGE